VTLSVLVAKVSRILTELGRGRVDARSIDRSVGSSNSDLQRASHSGVVRPDFFLLMYLGKFLSAEEQYITVGAFVRVFYLPFLYEVS